MAVLSLFLPWAVTRVPGADHTENIGFFDFGSFPDSFSYSVTLFLIGTVVAFFSPMGGLLQLIGGVGFVLTTLSSKFPDFQIFLWLGVIVALASVSEVIVALIYPMGIGFESDKDIGLARLLTFSITR